MYICLEIQKHEFDEMEVIIWVMGALIKHLQNS